MPDFTELLELSNLKLKEFLTNIGVFDDVKIIAQLHKKDESILDSVSANSFYWDNDFYAWFFINGIPGGTDAYFWSIDDSYKEFLSEELMINTNMQKHNDRIAKSIGVGYRWNFRRSAGQPGIIVLSYGLIAASLCMLTDGLIYSDDGAWDYSLFPTTADDFFNWYFKPELSKKYDDKKRAEKCILLIHKEIENRN